MYLYTNGCSMTYGSELHDDPVTKICTNSRYRWERSWPGALCRLAGCSGVYNDSIPSGSNDRIVRTTVYFVVRRWLAAGLPSAQLLVVIGWSHQARREFFVDGSFRQVVPHHGYDIRPLDRLVRVYRDVAWDETESSWRFATQALTLASFLRDHGIKFLFFDAVVPNRLPDELAETPVARALLGVAEDGVDPSMAAVLRADPRNWTGQHPSEAGHAVWATHLVERLPVGLPAGPRPGELTAAELPVLGGTGAVLRHDVKEADTTGARQVGRYASALRRRMTAAMASDPFLYP